MDIHYFLVTLKAPLKPYDTIPYRATHQREALIGAVRGLDLHYMFVQGQPPLDSRSHISLFQSPGRFKCKS
ncbi:hypothetical protein CEXT_646791 [Caerostris extrusa]|uniref:Uncharacterized protein n=1 Tax=Caerostris extrusa TaxID=172846 RepID=A0AAV4UHW4_CAEEX|nr:hypothetical protein CEXT_646791 [Caerostris extrusa]